MSSSRRLPLALVLLALAPHAHASDLLFTQNPANGHWYGISYGPMSWYDAGDAATESGGYLTSIGSAAEQTWIQGALAPYGPWNFWTGLNDVATEGQFVWANGEPLAYTNWNPGQPNNGGGVEDAVELQPGASWRWNDQNPASTAMTKALAEVDGVPRIGWTLPTSVSVGTSPSFPAHGDLNGDQREDLVVPNSTNASVTILWGQASGVLGAPTTFSVPTLPRTAAVGDFDGDGHLDWAIACGASRVTVRYGDGAGNFAPALDIVLIGAAHGLAAADLNGDGRTDLAATSVDSIDRLHILIAGPARTFLPPVLYATGGRPYHVTAGDLEGDGDVDLVVANESTDDISVFRNTGNGSFTGSALLARGDSPRRIALADWNDDGLLDMAIPSFGANGVRMMFGLANGGFVPGDLIPGGTGPTWTEAVDTNGDGYLDIVTAGSTSNSILVQEVLQGGNFAKLSILGTISNVTAVVGLDLNGDGRADLAATRGSNNTIVQYTKLSRDCNANGRDDNIDIVLGGSTDCNGNLEPDECDLALGNMFDCDLNGIVDACEILANPLLDLDADGNLDECEVAGTPYCFGDGTGAACPCDPGQAGAPGSGCRNSSGNGARMDAFGNPAVSNDSVTLCVSGLLNTTTGLFFQGTAQQTGGFGAVRGDGLLCATGMVVRMKIRMGQGGTMALGHAVSGDDPVSVQGLLPAVGGTRYYQLWFRDPVPFCTSSTFNFTNGVRIVWTP